jgi:nitroreductase
MTTVPTKAVIDALHWRYATKKFEPAKRIPAGAWEALEHALVLSPSSFGLQPWKFIIVQDPATREKLSAASYGQRQPVDCSHFVVFAGHTKLDSKYVDTYVARIAEVRGVHKESLKGYGDIMKGSAEQARTAGYLDAWAARQVYIALGEFMTAAALLGVDTCPMEGIEPAKYNEILGLSAIGYNALCACAAGYRATDDKYAGAPKVRFKPQDVIIRF